MDELDVDYSVCSWNFDFMDIFDMSCSGLYVISLSLFAIVGVEHNANWDCYPSLNFTA